MERDFETVALLPVFRRIEIQICSDNSVSNLSGNLGLRQGFETITFYPGDPDHFCVENI